MAVQHTTDETVAEFFADHLSRVDDDTQCVVALEVLEWVHEKHPESDARITQNQPIFTPGGTFIIGSPYAKKHMAITPECAGIEKFSDEFDAHGLPYGKMMVRFPWPKDGKAGFMPLSPLVKMIEFNMKDKRGMTKFRRQVGVNCQPGDASQLQCQLADTSDDLWPHYSPIDALQHVRERIVHR